MTSEHLLLLAVVILFFAFLGWLAWVAAPGRSKRPCPECKARRNEENRKIRAERDHAPGADALRELEQGWYGSPSEARPWPVTRDRS